MMDQKPTDLQSPSMPTSPRVVSQTQSARRSRRDNAAHRANDIEFATEIGQSLLGEVRRLQALMLERDEQIAALSREKDSLYLSLEEKDLAIKTSEESVGPFRFCRIPLQAELMAALIRSLQGRELDARTRSARSSGRSYGTHQHLWQDRNRARQSHQTASFRW